MVKKGILFGLIIIGLIVLAIVYRGVFTGSEVETEAACFEFDNEKGEITKYKQICGVKVVIPQMIDDVEVVAIGNYAFRGLEIESVSIPETVKELGIGAFYSCELEEVKLREGLEVIKPYAFYDNNLKRLEIPETVNRIGVAAFSKNDLREQDAYIYFRDDSANVNDTILIGYGGSETEIVIPEQVVTVYLNALEGLDIEKVTFSENIQRIEFSAFANNKISTLVIPSNIVHIGENAFSDNPIESIQIEGKSDYEEFNYLGENWHGGTSNIKFK